jgi:RNA polymerase primary sigma factor
VEKVDKSSSLSLYFSEVDGGKLLTKAQEIELAKKMQDGDRRAKNKLITANLRLVVAVAKKYKNQGCDYEDLIQEGNLGLIDGIERFDWTRNYKLSTYCTWWINQKIGRFIANQGRTVRVPVHVQTLSSKARKLVGNYKEKLGCDPTIFEVSGMLGCTKEMAKAVMESFKPIVSLDHSPTAAISNQELHVILKDNEATSPFDFVNCSEIVGVLRKVIGTLSPREDKILRLRFGIGANPKDHTSFPITRKKLKELKRKRNT